MGTELHFGCQERLRTVPVMEVARNGVASRAVDVLSGYHTRTRRLYSAPSATLDACSAAHGTLVKLARGHVA